MAMENRQKIITIILIIVVAFVVICTLYMIVSMILDYKKENQRVKELIEKNKRKMSIDEEADDLQMAYAIGADISPTQRELGEFYSQKNHFTDTGRSQLRGVYSNDNEMKKNCNFVIIKSVIYTETREELI